MWVIELGRTLPVPQKAEATFMLNMAVRNTKKLIREKSREQNVRIGRFFTKKGSAALMAVMCRATSLDTVSILDPGAGTGILSAALVERLCLTQTPPKTIELVCYENDAMMLPMLEYNLVRLRRRARHDYGIKLVFTIRTENFILSAQDEPGSSFDYVIQNPPSELLPKDSPEVSALASLCAGATDIAFLFLAMGMKMLKPAGEMVALIPTAYAQGVYLDRIRLYLMETGRVARLHLFAAKGKGEKADTTKGNMIAKFIKTPAVSTDTVSVSSSYSDGDGGDITVLPPFPYERIVNTKNGTLLLLKSKEEAEILARVESLPETMSSLGLRMRTGLTLESRYPDSLRDDAVDGALPLIHPKSIRDGLIHLPTEKYIIPVIPSLAQKNKNMLFIKRVPAKSDKRHLLCGVYLASQFPRNTKISTHNKLNYIDYADDREMDPAMLFGLYGVLSSDLYESYCTILSKASQINAADYGNLPLPDVKTLREIGNQLLLSRLLSPKVCSVVVQNALRQKNGRTL